MVKGIFLRHTRKRPQVSALRYIARLSLRHGCCLKMKKAAFAAARVSTKLPPSILAFWRFLSMAVELRNQDLWHDSVDSGLDATIQASRGKAVASFIGEES